MTRSRKAEITPEILLRAYSIGLFPMAESADDPSIYWVEPEMRGIIPLNDFHISKSLAKAMRRKPFDIRIDFDFRQTMERCAEPAPDRPTTWINETILDLYTELHELGHAHSVEAWADGEMVGGLYGVSLGAAFFGESMFSRQTNASKICLVHLVDHLKANGFELLDTQFTTDHLVTFGAIDVPKAQYQILLENAAFKPHCSFGNTV